MNTELGQKALNNINVFKCMCTDKEIEFLTNQIKEFDRLNTGFGFYAIQANIKLKSISKMDLKHFLGVMWVYFGKSKEECFEKGNLN